MRLCCYLSSCLILFLLVPLVLVSFYVFKWNREAGRQFLSDFDWPLCKTDDEILVLDRIQEQDNSNVVGDFNNWNNKKCQLRRLTSRDVVSCVDNLHANSSRPWIHFAFIGDLRIRQQFYNFLKVRSSVLLLHYVRPGFDQSTVLSFLFVDDS